MTIGKAFGNFGGYIVGAKQTIDMIRSYGSGFIFTTSLPPTVLRGALSSIRILRSAEGQTLRSRHQKNVSYLRKKLIEAGIAVVHTPSHIIPVHVGDPEINSMISDALIRDYGHYVQAINYPTVPKGEEKLRIAPTPHHTEAMMNQFVEDLKSVWISLGLEKNLSACSGGQCEYCKKPVLFDKYESRDRFCEYSECPQLISA